MIFRIFLYGLFFALASTPLVRFFARKCDAVDHPDGGRKTHENPTPLLGGLAVFAAFSATVMCLHSELLGGFLLGKHLLGLLAGSAFLVFGGILDDRYRLRPLFQMLFPVLASLTVIASGIGADIITNPFGGAIRLDGWNGTLFRWHGVPYQLTLPADLFTFAWIMGMTYTTKLLDGLDGLVSGLGLIGFVVIALLSLTPEVAQPELAMLAMAAAGAQGGFLIFNARPASIFLGEGGSTLVGFLLGTFAILSGAKIGITLLVLAVPIMDAAWTIMRRLISRASLAQGDAEHLHFRLVRGGLSVNQAVALFWIFAAAFGGAGLFIRGQEKLLALGILAILFLLTMFIFRRRIHGRPENRQ